MESKWQRTHCEDTASREVSATHSFVEDYCFGDAGGGLAGVAAAPLG
jgi:hypothetical protein